MLNETISHYHLLRKLGAGGMGEVYLAEDAQLGRTVALKILPADVAHDRERMYRFLQEARTASALNHPNIAHIYEIGEFNGVSFIVMEYVEGQTLDAKNNGRSIDASEIIKIGIEIADALTEAHAKGITHRDIKPSNIILTSRGGVKVLDFGLAKVAKVTGEEPQNAASDISTQIKTTPGTVMGTVLYEMITGRLPFAGKTANEKDKARDVLDELKERSKQEYVSPYYLAMIYAGLDEKNKAFKCLEKAYKERSSWMPRLKVEPKFDRLRSDPRFADLLRRVGLPPSAIEPAR